METEPGGGEEWSPIREVENATADLASVLMATEGENSASLGLVRGVIVPTVIDDQEMARSLFIPALIQKDASPQTQLPKGQANVKPSPMRKVASSGTLRPTSAPGTGSKRSSSQPPRNPKTLGPSPSSAQKGTNSHGSAREGSFLQGKSAPKNSSSAALAIGGSASEGAEQVAKSAALAEGFLASLQAGGLVKEPDGKDLLFTFSDDSDDEASAEESLQSEMDKVRQQMQRLEEGRKSRETSAPFEENGARTKASSDAARPPSGKGLSRLAGRLGPLKGVSSPPMGGLLRTVVADPVIAAKTASVESALEEMRRRVEVMEREMKQGGKGGMKAERPTNPPTRKAGKQEGGGAQKGGSAQQEGYRTVAHPEKREGKPVARVIAPSGILGTKKERQDAGREMRDGGLQPTVDLGGFGTAVRKKEMGASAVEAVQQGAGVQGRNGPGGERAETRSGREGRVVSELKVERIETGIKGIEEKGQSTSAEQRVEGRARADLSEGVQEGVLGEKAVKNRGGNPASNSPQRLSIEGKASPGKRKAAPARIVSVAKLQKLEGKSAKDRAPVSNPEVKAAAGAHPPEAVDHKQGFGNPSHASEEARMLLTSATLAGGAAGTPLGEAGALVPAEVGVMMTDLGVTSAEVGVMSAERQLALLAREDEQCWEALRASEEAAADAAKRREELQRKLAGVEQTDREARGRVLLMQQKLEGNRRLRVELELRDRMERRLREVSRLVKPGGVGVSGSGMKEAISESTAKRAIGGVLEMEGDNDGVSGGGGREEAVLAGGHGAVWTHEAHKGGYVVSQLEDVEGFVCRDLHQTAEVRGLEMAQEEVSKTEGEPVFGGGKFPVEELAFEMGGEKSPSAPGEIKAVNALGEVARRSGGAESKGVVLSQNLEANPKTEGTGAAAQLPGGTEPDAKGLLEAAAPSSGPGPGGGVEKQGQDGLGVDPLASAGQQTKPAVSKAAEQQLDQTAREHADLQLDKASQVGKQAPTRKRAAESGAGGDHEMGTAERKGVLGQAPEGHQKRARVGGVTGGSVEGKTTLAGVTGGDPTEAASLAGATGGSEVEEARLAGVTGGSKVEEARLAAMTGGSKVGEVSETEGKVVGGCQSEQQEAYRKDVVSPRPLTPTPHNGSSEIGADPFTLPGDPFTPAGDLFTPPAVPEPATTRPLEVRREAGRPNVHSLFDAPTEAIEPLTLGSQATREAERPKPLESADAAPHGKALQTSQQAGSSKTLKRTEGVLEAETTKPSTGLSELARRELERLGRIEPPEVAPGVKASNSSDPELRQAGSPKILHPPAAEASKPLPEQAGLEPKTPKPLENAKAPKPGDNFESRLAELLASTPPPTGPFRGALGTFRSFRLTPQYTEVWGHGFGSLTWSNQVSPNWPLCAVEVVSGTCASGDCKYQHERDYVLGEEAVLKQLQRYGDGLPPLHEGPRAEKATLEERAAHVVAQLGWKGISVPNEAQPAPKNWTEAPIPIYRVGNYLMDHRERLAPSGRVGLSTPRALASSLLSPGLVRPLPTNMPFIGDIVGEDEGSPQGGWRYWAGAADNFGPAKDMGSWEAALQKALDTVDNNLETRNAEKRDQALAILARALEDHRRVPPLWAVYLELFIRRAKSDEEAVEMMEVAVRFNPNSYALWTFYVNTRTNVEDKLRICSRARSSIVSSLMDPDKQDERGGYSAEQSAALLDLTLRRLHFHTEVGQQQAAVREVQALLHEATKESPPIEADEMTSVKHPSSAANGKANGIVQPVEDERLVVLRKLTPSDSVVLWVSCAHLLAYGVLPECTASRLGFMQVLVSPEETWRAKDCSKVLPGSEVAVLPVFQVAANHFSARTAQSKSGQCESMQAWRTGLHSLASHSVAVTASILGLEQALTVCNQLLEVYPGHTDLAYRRASMMLGELGEQGNAQSQMTKEEVDEALQALQLITTSLSPLGSEATAEKDVEKEADQYLALLRCAELLREWRSAAHALDCLHQKIPREASGPLGEGGPQVLRNGCVEALCCRALRASLEGDCVGASALLESALQMAHSREHIRLVAEQAGTCAPTLPLAEALPALSSILKPSLATGDQSCSLELSIVAPPWEHVASESLQKQLMHAWWKRPAWDYPLVNEVVRACLPGLQGLPQGGKGEILPHTAREIVSSLEYLVQTMPGNLALSLAAGKLCEGSMFDSSTPLTQLSNAWIIPIIAGALFSALPTVQAELWEQFATFCTDVDEEAAAREIKMWAKLVNR